MWWWRLTSPYAMLRRWLHWLPDLRVEAGEPAAVGSDVARTPGVPARVGAGQAPIATPVWLPATDAD